MTGWCSFWEWT